MDAWTVQIAKVIHGGHSQLQPCCQVHLTLQIVNNTAHGNRLQIEQVHIVP